MNTENTQNTEYINRDQNGREHISHSTLLAYASYCTESFAEEAFNEVDSLLFSWMAYLKIPTGVLPSKILITDDRHEDCIYKDTDSCKISDFVKDEYLSELVYKVNSQVETIAIIKAAAKNPRFANVRLCLRREETDRVEGKQFAAVCFQISPELTYVAFRGTDSTLTGWKEDFRLCLNNPVPSQKLAAEYLSAVGHIFRGKLLVGGHSKGGNLAVYAAANCDVEVQERIQSVYSHDGPGFTKAELLKEGYAKIRSRIQKTAPQFSIFGMLLRQEAEPKIIYSFGDGLLQHDATSWKTEWYSLSDYWYSNKISTHIKNKLNNWLESLSDEDKETFIDWLFGVLEHTGFNSVEELKANIITLLPVFMKEFAMLNSDMQKFLMELVGQFIFASDENRDPSAEPGKATGYEQKRNTETKNLNTGFGGAGRNRMNSAADDSEKYSNYPADIRELMRKYADQPAWDGKPVSKQNKMPSHAGYSSDIQDLMRKYDLMDADQD